MERLPEEVVGVGRGKALGEHAAAAAAKSLSRVRLFATPWTEAPQALLSIGFSRQEYWGGEPLPSPSEHRMLSK